MRAILDRMLWIPRDAVNSLLIDERLTVEARLYNSSRLVKLYEVCGDYVGVPRAWGLKQKWLIDGMEIEDRTAYNKGTWGSFEGEYREGQKECVEAISGILSSKYGSLIQATPAFGKTLCGLDIARRLNTNVIILVHKEDLARQWQDSAIRFFNVVPGHIQRDNWAYAGKTVVTACVQTLFSRHSKVDADFWRYFGMMIADEVHRFPSRTLEKVMKQFHSRYRLGVSATYRRKDGLECIWHWHIGSIDYKSTVSQMSGEYVQIIWRTNLSDSLFRRGLSINHSKYLNAIKDNAAYNRWLINEIKLGAIAGRKIIVVSDRIQQLVFIRNGLLKEGVSAGLYVGQVDGRYLDASELEVAKKCQVILGSYGKISEGTNIPELDTLYLASPRSDIEQTVGRIRRFCKGKKKLLIIDPVFDTPYMRRLAKKREVWYEKIGFKKYRREQ